MESLKQLTTWKIALCMEQVFTVAERVMTQRYTGNVAMDSKATDDINGGADSSAFYTTPNLRSSTTSSQDSSMRQPQETVGSDQQPQRRNNDHKAIDIRNNDHSEMPSNCNAYDELQSDVQLSAPQQPLLQTVNTPQSNSKPPMIRKSQSNQACQQEDEKSMWIDDIVDGVTNDYCVIGQEHSINFPSLRQQVYEEKQVPIILAQPSSEISLYHIFCDEPKHVQDMPTSLQTVRTSRALSMNIIPSNVRNAPNNVYNYMNKFMAIKNNKFCTVKGSIIVDFHFVAKHSAESLYSVIVKSAKSAKYNWIMQDRLYTQKELMSEELIDRSVFQPLSQPRLNMLRLPAPQDLSPMLRSMVKRTKWTKIPIQISRKNNKRRHVLHLTKEAFVDALNVCLETEGDQIRAIPVMLTNSKDQYWMEHVFIFQIEANICVGIRVKYKHKSSRFEVTQICLQKQYILDMHELATAMDITHDCHCLNGFVSIIDDLRIGNPDDLLNRLKAKEREIKKLKAKEKDQTL